MKVATVTIEGVSPLSQSKAITTEKLPRELADAYEQRTWRERMHVNERGNVFMPPMYFKLAISNVARYLGMPVPGKGKRTFTKHFVSGVLVVEPIELPIKAKDVECEKLLVSSQGSAGGGTGTRVWKYFPYIPRWGGDVRFLVLDEIITSEVFEEHIRQAGQFIGVGRFRPQNNGYYGRFAVKNIAWFNGNQ